MHKLIRSDKTIEVREDVFQGEEHHPQCVFFDMFPSSPDPYETFYGELFCHMKNDQEVAEICKGDYIKCPLASYNIVKDKHEHRI